jgi:hypothetical protein
VACIRLCTDNDEALGVLVVFFELALLFIERQELFFAVSPLEGDGVALQILAVHRSAEFIVRDRSKRSPIIGVLSIQGSVRSRLRVLRWVCLYVEESQVRALGSIECDVDLLEQPDIVLWVDSSDMGTKVTHPTAEG